VEKLGLVLLGLFVGIGVCYFLACVTSKAEG